MKREEIVSQLGGIKLKNINLTGISNSEQAKKVNEEMKEFVEAFAEYIANKTEEN